jgi:flagellar basal body P-ring formation protein FlgA
LGEGRVRGLHVLVVLVMFFVAAPARSADLPSAVPARQDLTGSATLVSALRGHILQSCRCPAESVEILSASSPSGLVLPGGDTEFHVLPKSPPARYHHIVMGVEALSGGKPVGPFWILVDAAVHSRFVRAKRNVPFGAALSVGDIEVVDGDCPDIRADYFSDVQQVAGKITRRGLVPGDAVTRDVVSDPFVVKAGDMVLLRVDRGGVALAATVRAEQNGRIGQVVRVRNLEFSRALKARVVAPGEVRVE